MILVNPRSLVSHLEDIDVARSARYVKCLTNMLEISEPDEFSIVKLVYLIQEWGINLGFRFGWFIYNPLAFEGPFTIGPYSTQLLYYIDEIQDEMGKVNNPCEGLSEDEIYRLKSIAGLIKYLMGKKKGLRSTLQYTLELVTSLHFTFKYVQMPGDETERLNRLMEVKQELVEEDLKEALELMRRIGVL